MSTTNILREYETALGVVDALEKKLREAGLEELIRSRKPKRQKYPPIEGYEIGDLVWIVRKSGHRQRGTQYIAGRIEAVHTTQAWVKYQIGDTWHFNYYYPERLLHRKEGETAPESEMA